MRSWDYVARRDATVLETPRPPRLVPPADPKSVRRTNFRRELRELGAVWAGVLLIMAGTLAVLCVLALFGSISP
jgi:hypothetical protein